MLGIALVAKCSAMEKASEAFEQLPARDVCLVM